MRDGQLVKQDVDCTQRLFLMVALVLSSGVVKWCCGGVGGAGGVVGFGGGCGGGSAGCRYGVALGHVLQLQYVARRAAWPVSGCHSRRHVRAGLCRGLNTQAARSCVRLSTTRSAVAPLGPRPVYFS